MAAWTSAWNQLSASSNAQTNQVLEVEELVNETDQSANFNREWCPLELRHAEERQNRRAHAQRAVKNAVALRCDICVGIYGRANARVTSRDHLYEPGPAGGKEGIEELGPLRADQHAHSPHEGYCFQEGVRSKLVVDVETASATLTLPDESLRAV